MIRCYSINTTICDNGNRIDSNCDHDLVHYGDMYAYIHAYYVVQLLLYNIQRSIGCNNSNTTNCDDNNVRYTAGLFFLLIVMEHKIDNISKINDNNFGFTHCNMMQCDYINNIHIHLYNWIPKTKKDHNTARDNNQYPTYQVHKSLFYIYGIDTDCDYDHMLLRYNECNNMICRFSLLWKQVSKNNYNDDVGTLQSNHFDIGTVQCRNNNTLSFYCP